jgi:transposase-like protein
MLYNWQAKSRQTGQPFEKQKLQQVELARLKRENARLEEEVAFLKKAAVSSTSRRNTLIKFFTRRHKAQCFPGSGIEF